jgi:hypothetical protein
MAKFSGFPSSPSAPIKKTFTVTLIALFTLSLTLDLIQSGKIQRFAQILKTTVKPNENETNP